MGSSRVSESMAELYLERLEKASGAAIAAPVKYLKLSANHYGLLKWVLAFEIDYNFAVVAITRAFGVHLGMVSQLDMNRAPFTG